MATQPDDEDDTLELTADQQLNPDEDQDDEQRSDDDESGDDSNLNDEDGEETIVSFGEAEEEQEGDTSTIRHLRQQLKDAKERARELERSQPARQKIEVGPEPTMDDEDVAWDADVFKDKWTAWNKRKEAAAAQEREQETANAEVQRAWEADVAAFAEKRARLAPTIPDFDDLQQTVAASLDLAQQAVLVKAASDPALFMAAVGKNPAKLAELAKIKDVIKLAAAIARMEGSVKVVKKRKGPAIDRAQQGSGKTPEKGDTEKQLEKLEKDAASSGDRTKLIAFKRKHGL